MTNALRFGFLALTAALLAALAPAAHATTSAPGRLDFEVTRNGQPFGRHTVTVSRTADGGLSVRNEVALRATVGPVTVYRYEHRCTETWRGGVFQAMDCTTRKGGRSTTMTAVREGDRVITRGPAGVNAFVGVVLPTTWWTRATTQASPLIDAETGAPMPIRSRRIGTEVIEAGGAQVTADRFRLQASLTLDLWYDARGRWVGCEFTAQGQNIRYRLVSPLAAAPA